jgi:hypothetical protein
MLRKTAYVTFETVAIAQCSQTNRTYPCQFGLTTFRSVACITLTLDYGAHIVDDHTTTNIATLRENTFKSCYATRYVIVLLRELL